VEDLAFHDRLESPHNVSVCYPERAFHFVRPTEQVNQLFLNYLSKT